MCLALVNHRAYGALAGISLLEAEREPVLGLGSLRWLHTRGDCRGCHLELIHDVQSLLDVERQRLKTWVDVNLTLLRDHVLRDDVQICERLVHEGCHVVCPLQDFGIYVGVYEI